MVGEIKQKHRERSPVGKSDYTLLGWFSCWESACIFPHCIWRSLIVLCCSLQQNWKEYDEISQSPESSFVQQIQPWPFLMFSFPSFPHFCWLVFSWMLPLKPPYQYSEMISEVWIKSIKSSRDQVPGTFVESEQLSETTGSKSLGHLCFFFSGRGTIMNSLFYQAHLNVAVAHVWSSGWVQLCKCWHCNFFPGVGSSLQGQLACCAIAWIWSWCWFRCSWRTDPVDN